MGARTEARDMLLKIVKTVPVENRWERASHIIMQDIILKDNT